MGRNTKKIVSFLMLSFAIVIITGQCINSNAGGLKGVFVTEGQAANLCIESVEVPDEAVEYANQSVGMLFAEVFGNESGYDVTIEDYSKLELGEPFTVLSQSKEQDQIYSFPVMEGDEIKMILSVFKTDGVWNASLGKDFADELNELKGTTDEKFVLYVEDGDIYAQNEEEKMLIEETNYDYQVDNATDFDEGVSYDEIIEKVEKIHGGKEIEQKQIMDTVMDSEEMVETISFYSPEFESYYSEWEEWINDWFRRWRPEPCRPTASPDDSDVTPSIQPEETADVTPVDPVEPEETADVTPVDPVTPVEPEETADVTPVDPVNPVEPEETADVTPVEPDDDQPYIPDDDQPAVTEAPVVTTAPDDGQDSGNGVGALSSQPFSVNTDTAKTLNTEGCAVNQQDKGGTERGLCWAATSATIINYVNGDGTMRGYAIADEMGVGYDTGGTLQDIQTALSNHGISYTVSESQTSMDTVVSCISNKKPMAMCAYASAGGHAVTIVGYSKGNSSTVTIWNSGNQQMQTCTYQSSGTSFTYGGYKFTWYATVYSK